MRLACLLPIATGEEPLVAIPLVLPMGWTESAPYFCAAIETIVDLANDTFNHSVHHLHRLEHLLDLSDLPNPSPPPSTTTQRHTQVYDTPLANADVYMDDVIGIYQPASMSKQKFARHILHTIDHIFRPLESSDPPARTEPISTAKLMKGDGNLTTRKAILGWIIDTTKCTLELPVRRLHRLQQLLDELPRSKIGFPRNYGRKCSVNSGPCHQPSQAAEASLAPSKPFPPTKPAFTLPTMPTIF
jgi:hypothetical protein